MEDNLPPGAISNNLMKLLPIVLNVEKENFTITPSEFIREMSLTTEERYKKLVYTANLKMIIDSNYPPQFKVLPNIIMFQRFEPRVTYSLMLEVKNVGKALLPLKMCCPQSIYFSANHVGTPINKIAPGLNAEYEIIFSPKEAKDYSHYLVFRSHEDTFQVPIVAIGPRPLLDIPDQIVLNSAPVKLATSKFIVVRNIGNAPAVFNFVSQSDLFNVSPSKGLLGVHDSMLVNISFESSKVGEVSEPLYLTLETGEKLMITLHGSAENVGVRLDKNSIVQDDTYVGLKRCKTIRLVNSSSSVVKFFWKKHKSDEEDINVIESMKGKYIDVAGKEILQDTKILNYELSDFQTHKLSCERILMDELKLLEKEKFLFFHEAFSITPQSGEVWPKSSVEMIVAFEPKVCGSVNAEAYLEVSGRDSRLPLRIKGNGLGPNIVLTIKTLNIDYIYLCSLHKYEITTVNKGDIPGTIEYKIKPLVFGGKIEVTPDSRYLKPGECNTFVINFTSNRQGDFTEILNFNIKESGESVFLVFEGKIISPTLHFDIRQVDFGIIPVGFPTVREVTLNNLSMVPVTFSLRILSDGEVPSLSFEQFAKLTIKPNLPKSPKEFLIDPEESIVEPFSNKKVTLTLTANRVGHFLSYLLVDMWDSESGSVSCPIHFHPHIATIIADPEIITIPFCFINFPYTRSITLRNLSKIPGFFYILPSDPNTESSITCSANIPQGVIDPRSSTKIDITVMTSALGRQVVPISLIVFGHDNPRDVCTISCVGQGPVVTVIPSNLTWGDLPLLEEVQNNLLISNESPIPASLNIYLTRLNSPWSATPSNFTLAPAESITVTITLLLNDRGKFTDTLKVNVHNGKIVSVPLSATGVGSSLKITPNINPKYDLGRLFSHKKYDFEITLENKGTKPYGLIWSPFPEYKSFVNAKFMSSSDLLFKLVPSKLDLLAGESKYITLEVQSTSVGYSFQTFYCFANIGTPAKELHMTCEVFAEFVEPLITFDKDEIKYWYNVGCDGTEQKLEDIVQVTNMSVLPVCVNVSANYPFYIDRDTGECAHSFEMDLSGNESKTLTVKFIAETDSNRFSQVFEESLTIAFTEHSRKCSVVLIGEVNYPNVVILPKNVNFDYVPVGINASQEICLVNISPLTVYYQITWNLLQSSLTYFETTEIASNEIKLFDNTEEVEEYNGECETPVNSNCDVNEWCKETVLDMQMETSQQLFHPVKPVPKMPKIIISKSDIKATLFPLTRNYFKCDDELMNAYRLARSSEMENSEVFPEFKKICDITPFYGKLNQFSSQILTVRFCSDYPVIVHVEAFVNILSGPTEVISINGCASKIDFQLSQVEFDFGKQLFCETQSQVLKIQNVGAMPFSYEAKTKDTQTCDLNDDFPLGKGVLTISPHSGSVTSFSEVELIIRYHPGIPGKFEDKFHLQIGYLDPIIIKVKGFGVFPQVHASLHRPEMLNIPPEVGYLAVASITPDWFLTGFNSSVTYDLYSVAPYRSQESNLNDLSEELDLLQDDWEYLKNFDSIPSEIDIQLAVERILAFNLVSKDPLSNATFAVYARTIPQFYVPAYEIDFGIVVTGRAVEQNVTVSNYGPLFAIMYGIFDSQLKEDGFHIRLKNRNELKIGAYLPFIVCFHPKKIKYRKRLEIVHNLFYFEIYHGPKIPIKIYAKVTYPHVIPSMYILNYFDVVCGYCKVINLKLKNPGLVPATWSIIYPLCSNKLYSKSKFNGNNEKSMFHVSHSSGTLNPEEYCSVQISFKPEFGGSFSTTLCINVSDSLEEIMITLNGEGIEPKLKISKSFIEFGPTLPYPKKSDKYFSVGNPCSFPVEFYFPTFDEQQMEEERIIRAVCQYYQTNELLLPVRKPGDGLPIELVNFYYMLLEELNTNFIEQELEREALEENSFLSSEDDPLVFSSQMSLSDKRKRTTKKSFSRSKTTMGSTRMFSTTFENRKEIGVRSIFEKKTSIEIEEMLKDYIKKLLSKDSSYDPVQAALKSALPSLQEEKYKNGTLIIFHGAPFSSSVQFSNRAALFTGLPNLNIDKIVLEEAALGRCEAGLTAKDLIDQSYCDYIGVKPQTNFPDSHWEETDEDIIAERSDFNRDFYEIQCKFNALIYLRDSLLLNKGKGPKTSSAKSDGSRKLEKFFSSGLKHMNVNAPIAHITEELVLEILKYRIPLEVVQGVVIEGLYSYFIQPPVKALTSLLKAAGNTKDILFVFLLNNYANYNQYILNKQAEQENTKAQIEERILRILEEEPEEIFESLELNDFEAEHIRSNFISQRHESYKTFVTKKDIFYDMKKTKKESIQKSLEVSLLSLNTKFDGTSEKPQKGKKDKERKRDVNKEFKSPDVSGRKPEGEIKSAKIKKDSIEGEFIAFEMEFIEMKSIIDNWDQRGSAIMTEGSSEPKVKKGHTAKKTESNFVEKKNNDRGIFLWLVDASKPESNIFASVCCYLKTVLHNRCAPSESDSWPLVSTESMSFSVVTNPPMKNKVSALDIYALSQIETVMMAEDSFEDSFNFIPASISSLNLKLDRSASQISFKSKRRAFSLAKRKKAESRMPNARPKKSSLGSLIEDQQVRSRWVLQPGEKINWRVRYFPVELGRTEQIFPINIVNWQNGDVIRCVGICDIPSLDMTPEVVFPFVETLKPLTSPHSPAYYRSEDSYDFGSIVTFQPNDGKKTTKKSAVFTLSNKSTLPLNLSIVLSQQTVGPTPINVEPDKMFLPSMKSLPLYVTAKPLKNGPVAETLMLFVKDNPKVEFIKVKCEGVKSSVTVDPKLVNFDRILLHRKDFRRVAFSNNNLIPLYIKLSGFENLPSQFTFSNVSGWAPALGVFIIEVHYYAKEIQLISEQLVQVQVFVDAEAEEPVQEFSFALSVEAYDAALDIIFSSKDDDHIDFGDIRVENNYTNVFNLKNIGKYPLAFKIDIDSRFLTEVENQFFISPQEGKLPPGKIFPINASFVTQNEVTWKRIPLLRILLVDPYNADELIATIPIEVSVKSFFAQYVLKPEREFNFGHIRVGSPATGTLLIQNQGHFSLSFFIENKSTVHLSEGNNETNKKSSKPSASSKEKGKKISSLGFTVGVFEISPSYGVAEVGETASVQITCLPAEVKTFEEEIVIIVNESFPQFKSGSELTIKAVGCLPNISFCNIKSIFREHFICKSEREFNNPAKFGSYTLFSENNSFFYFKNCCLCKTQEARIHLPNVGLIECQVTATVVVDEEGSSTGMVKTTPYFDVYPSKLIIEPYDSGTLLLTFRPEAIEVYKAQLIITLEMPEVVEDIIKTISLWGNGILPQIEIIEPSKLLDGQVLVNFPPTSPGYFSSSSIAFLNVGQIECKVILELYKQQENIFTLSPKPSTEKMLKIWELEKPIDHSVIVSVSPGQVAEFNTVFSPKESKSYSSQIKLLIVDNPFENLCYKLMGDAFFEEVVIENLRTMQPFLGKQADDDRFLHHATPGKYVLNFGDCYVNKASKALFRLVNKSEKDYFKFQWEGIQNITVSPTVGHLYPNSYKEVLLVFCPEEPMELEEASLVCVINKVLLECESEPSWDSRLIQHQNKPSLITILSPYTNEKQGNSQPNNYELTEISGEEPKFEVIPDSSQMILINIFGTADYARINCETSKIIFKNTFMFQTRTYPLVLGNSGNVTLQYKLTLKSVTAGPVKENKILQVEAQSLLKLRQTRSRPQSSSNVPSYGSHWAQENSNCTHPRPLTSVPLLNPRENQSKCKVNEDELRLVTDVNQPTTTYNPFVVENLSGHIFPKETVTCSIIFSPMDIREYRAIIKIEVPNLHPECILPDIEIIASSVMPYCHFNISESDYLESGRRDYSRPGPVGYAPGLPLSPNTKTIEIKVLGTGFNVPIKFHVINPTEKDYKFMWSNNSQSLPEVVPSFYCLTPSGKIQAGRQQLMEFSFVSQRTGINEFFWKFLIPDYGVDTQFLFVCDVREPAVYFLSNYINLRPTFIGSTSSNVLTLINNENTPFDFYFLDNSLYSEGRLNVLKVEPSTGNIPSNTEINIRVTFTGKTGGKILFYLKCKVKNIKSVFIITVETTTYTVQPLLVFEDLKKVKHYIDAENENLIDFGKELIPNRPETIGLFFTSMSKFSFYYEWIYDKEFLESRNCKIKLSTRKGHVTSFSRGECYLTIVFHKKSSLTNFSMKLKIKRGPLYSFLINASASTPICDFSFNTYDFGYCFLQEKDICFYEIPLTIKNKDVLDVVLECYLQDSSSFSFTLPEAIISSGKEVIMIIRFHPKACIPYLDVLNITLNGIHQKLVTLKGHGTDFKVTLTNAEDTTISLGAVKIGKSSTRKFSLINQSLAVATVLVGFSDQFPVDSSYFLHPKNNSIDLSKDHRLSEVITISPSTLFSINPQEVHTLSVCYTPSYRSASFSETISLQFQEKVEPLCIISGCCLGPDISLDRCFLNFGAVVKTCKSVLKLKLVNSGSIGARFEWNTKLLENNYFIYPVSGYVSPESDVTVQITFHPFTARNCIKEKVECKLFLSETETYPSLFLNLIGDCVDLPRPSQVVSFKCFVREKDSKTLQVENSSGNEWQLVPIISGEYFKGYEAFTISPMSVALYEVNYCPLTMTEEENLHEGSVFFRLPNGQGLLYYLRGTALPPNPEEVVVREIPCKTKYTELLKVQNWLQYPQRFRVNISCVANDNAEDPVWTCTGFENFELPSSNQKVYNLNFFAYKLGSLRFYVSFINEETKEYLWYDITFNIVMCGPLEIITLKSGVRQTCHHEVKLENPLKKLIQYKLESTSPEVHFESSVYEVPPEQVRYVNISFTPTHVKEQTEKLYASCEELGIFPRELRLISLDVQPDPPRTFETPLGTSQSQEICIKNLSHLNAVLHCKTDSEDFIVNEKKIVAAGQNTYIKITYEPSEIVTSSANLYVESEEAGNFIFPLVGVCNKPLAKGPYILRPGSGIHIPFKNVLRKPKDFHMYVNNPAFTIKSAQETISSKGEFKIHVTFQKIRNLEKSNEYREYGIEPRFPIMGQVIVECFNPYIKWQFYLKGVLDKS